MIVSPLKIRRFAGAIGQLANTDEIDARLIARFAATLQPAAQRQLTTLRTMEKDRRQVMPEAPKHSIDRIIETLDRGIESLEQLVQHAVDQHAAWRHKRDLLT